MSLPGIDIITLLYRCEKHLDNYLKALLLLDYPPDKLRINLLDNTGDPLHLEMVRQTLKKYSFPFNVRLEATEKNTGFSGGNNYYFEKLNQDADFPYFFLLNQDGQISKDCLKELNNFLINFPDTGMLEARQTPKEHPKYFDPETYETSWCSGGGVLISKKALGKSGFFDHNFFLYCEDVDLSWRIWLSGFSCRICPKATYYHQTEELDEGKDHSVRYYYSFRNTFYMHFKYDSFWGICRHFFRSIIVCLYQPPAKRKIYLRAFWAALKKLPFYISNRNCDVGSCKWINFAGFEFGKRREFMDMADGRRVFINK
jgi:GT2 family glycosyltransferase